MKDLITAIASILILMIFVMQFAGNQAVQNRIFQAELAVESFRDALKEDGRMSEENYQTVRQYLAEICGCQEGDILVESSGTGSPAVRGDSLYYRIQFPLKDLIVMGEFLGIKADENLILFDHKGWVVSCYEEPADNTGNSDTDDNGDGL